MSITPGILHLFGRQWGVASAAQLREHLTPRQLRRAVEHGMIGPEMPGVYRLAGAADTDASRIMALSLFAGESGFLSGFTAARVHGVSAVPRTVFEVMVSSARDPHLPAWAHSTRTSWRLVSDRRELGNGLVVASPLRTLFRVAAVSSAVRFEKVAEQMWHRRLITPNEAATYLSVVRRQGRHGVLRFEQWLEHAIGRPSPSQSTLEVDLAAAVAALGMPAPQRQHVLLLRNDERIHLDLAWPEARLGVEPGATFWHGGDGKVRSDHARDRACDEVGWRVLRFDEIELRDLDGCARQVVRIYRERSRVVRAAARRERPGPSTA